MKISPVLLGLSLAVVGSSLAAAQDAATTSVPRILQITREYTKPYKGGAAHDKTESAFVIAMNRAKFPAYYVGMNSMSGKARSLYMTRYTSFAEWEKDNDIEAKSAALAADVERASLADGELLEEVDSGVYTYEEELSFHPHNDIQKHHFYQIFVFHVRPGRGKEWHELVKMVKEAHEKAGDSAHWGMYSLMFGGEGGTYVALSGDPSMSAIDDAFTGRNKYLEALGGEEGMAKADALFGAAVDTSHSELFAVNPKQSYVSADWIKEDATFWKPVAAASKAQAAAAKPAAAAAAKPASR
ncbi:MAG: hypothetical protein WCA10_04590 [Terracidiphilus sp.]